MATEIIDGPRGALVAPFVPMLRSPELTEHAQRMGAYLRYRSALPLRLSELAILITARHWSQPVEWAIHAPIAEGAGLRASTVAAVARGTRPSGMADDEALVHDVCVALHRDQSLSDALWNAAVDRFGERGVVDLVCLNGYYALLAMLMNAARTPEPRNDPPDPSAKD